MSKINIPSFFKFIVIGFAISSSAFGMNKQEEKIIKTKVVETNASQINYLCCDCHDKKMAFVDKNNVLYVLDFETVGVIFKQNLSTEIKQLTFEPVWHEKIITRDANDIIICWDIKRNSKELLTNPDSEKRIFGSDDVFWYVIRTDTNTKNIIMSMYGKIPYKKPFPEKYADFEPYSKYYDNFLSTRIELYSTETSENLCPVALHILEKDTLKDSIFIEIFEYCSNSNRKQLNFKDYNGNKVKDSIIVDCEGPLTPNKNCSLFACIDSESHQVKIFDTKGQKKTLNIQCAPNSPLQFINNTHLLVTNLKEEKHFLYVFNITTGECIQKIPSGPVTSLCLAHKTILAGERGGRINYWKVNPETNMLETYRDASPEKPTLQDFLAGYP